MFEEPDFFKRLHVSDLAEFLPEVEKYLSLPLGYRFLIAEGYEDVLHDLQLNNI